MSKKLLVDTDLCTGCFSCEVACKQEHNLPQGPKLIRVIQVGPKKIGDKLVMEFVPSHCRHCEKPPCIEACPVDAITKRIDGLVLFDEDLCIGCGDCIKVCPFGAPQFNPEKNTVRACDLCYKRVERGVSPACVQNCPNNALSFEDPNDLSERVRQKRADMFLYRKYVG